MREAASKAVFLKDYAPPPFLIERITLDVDIRADDAISRATLSVRRNPASQAKDAPLVLDGEELELLSVLLDGKEIPFKVTAENLSITDVPESFTLETVSRLCPQKNTTLEGLYAAKSGFVTQCEAQGFRRITWFIDRPDNLARFTTTVRADRKKYPVLLSNGNLVASRDEANGRHWARFEDPFPKPSYLFALVAADLQELKGEFISKSKARKHLSIYVEPGKLDQAGWAMDCLKRAMRWDEERFGLELDLEEYKIVAVGDFNSGAMENKGLNIFNAKYVLARPDTATDTDYLNIDRVVAHEYFHNWTGNRVTCRDWFQLSLKEGLTVFRDQEFSADMAGSDSGRAVQRIQDVRRLRSLQFPEDAGPMAHPVRPDAYLEIQNFYTSTVYEKGAEVVRMMATLVGRDAFKRGLRLYLERHDGQAVTCDDFAQAIADAEPASALATRLPAFKRWYAQAGTPRLAARGQWNAAASTYTLTLAQSATPSPGQAAKLPFVIPVLVALYAADGRALAAERLLVLEQAEQRFVFEGIDEPPVPSLLRAFSAPVQLDDGLDDAARLTLLAHDTDAFNRFEAAQRLMLDRLLAAVREGGEPQLDDALAEALRQMLRAPGLDPMFKALALSAPDEAYIAEQLAEVDPQRIHAVRERWCGRLASRLVGDWQWAWEQHQVREGYRPTHDQAGRRLLAGMALAHLVRHAVSSGDDTWPGRAYQRFKDAGHMTDRLAALTALIDAFSPLAEPALERLHALAHGNALVLDKWFTLQATAPEPLGEAAGSAFLRARALLQHPEFSMRNPNRVRSLLLALAAGNPGAFHRADAAGYVLWAERLLELDAINPQLAGRFARVMDRWRSLAEPRRSSAREAIARVAARPDLSNDVREVVSRALADEVVQAASPAETHRTAAA